MQICNFLLRDCSNLVKVRVVVLVSYQMDTATIQKAQFDLAPLRIIPHFL